MAKREQLVRYVVRGSRSAGRQKAVFYCLHIWEARALRVALERAGWLYIEATDARTGEEIDPNEPAQQY